MLTVFGLAEETKLTHDVLDDTRDVRVNGTTAAIRALAGVLPLPLVQTIAAVRSLTLFALLRIGNDGKAQRTTKVVFSLVRGIADAGRVCLHQYGLIGRQGLLNDFVLQLIEQRGLSSDLASLKLRLQALHVDQVLGLELLSYLLNLFGRLSRLVLLLGASTDLRPKVEASAETHLGSIDSIDI